MQKRRIKRVIDNIIRRFSDSKTKSIFIRGSYALEYADEFSDFDIGILVDIGDVEPTQKELYLEYDDICVHIIFFSLPEIMKKLNEITYDSEFLTLAMIILHAKPVYDPDNTIDDLRRKLEDFPSRNVVKIMVYKAFSELTDARAALKSKRYNTASLNLRFLALTCAKLLVISEKGYWREKWLLCELEKIREKYEEEIKLIKDILGLNQNPKETQRLLLEASELCLKLENMFEVNLKTLS